MVKDWVLKIRYLESVDSTQSYLKKLLLDEKISSPYAVVSKIQTQGKGSRNNSWIGLDGNLFLSFSIPITSLPHDLKLESASIYFAYLMKMTLENENSQVWIKWPNDFYLEEKKVGGLITNIVKESLVCGVGLNLVSSQENFAKLDIEISTENLLQKYFQNLEKEFSWKQVFSKYKLEFYKSKNFSTHNNNEKISLGDASLDEDGSIISNNKRMYSLR
jgi:BirA family transcriptional regulator, biotin operon repressor / biotin---[acetyl-CoA-carboxylase] ligase